MNLNNLYGPEDLSILSNIDIFKGYVGNSVAEIIDQIKQEKPYNITCSFLPRYKFAAEGIGVPVNSQTFKVAYYKSEDTHKDNFIQDSCQFEHKFAYSIKEL